MPEGGFVKLWRSLRGSELLADPAMIQLWCWCLIRANWQDAVFRGELISRGSFVCDFRGVANELRTTKSSISRRFEKMKKAGQVSLKTVRKSGQAFTVVTICNYDTYQCRENDERDNIGTTSSNERDNIGTTSGQSKEDKKGRTNTRTKPPLSPLGEIVEAVQIEFPPGMGTLEAIAALDEWLAYKRDRKETYRRVGYVQKLVDGFYKKHGAEASKAFIEAVNHSIAQNWKGCFSPREELRAARGKVCTEI